MSFPPRRVVTGHDNDGRPIVTIDEPLSNLRTMRTGHTSGVAWSTDEFPADNTNEFDGALREFGGRSLDNGTVFRIARYDPGVEPAMHVTDTIDYAVILSGEIDMVLDENTTVHLTTGDVLVQRGTPHDWRNNGTEPCLIAFILVGAKPLPQHQQHDGHDRRESYDRSQS